LLRFKVRRASRYDVAFYVPSAAPLLARQSVLPTGGSETQVFLVSQALASKGLRVCLCVYEIPGGGIPDSLHGVDILHRRPYLGGRGVGSSVLEALAIIRTVAGLDADVIVTRIAGPHVGLVGLAAKFARRRFVYSSASLTDFGFRARRPKMRDSILYRLGLYLADDVVVQTEEQANFCAAWIGRKPIVVKSFVEPAPGRVNAPEAFLWVGRAAWYKRPLEYVELARALPEARFWMVAVPDRESGSLVGDIQKAAAEVPNLEVLEPRPRAELMGLIDRAVAIVNTSDFEGMPNVTLEGWARGVPALTLAYDPDALIEKRGLGEFARNSREDLVAGAKRLWDERYDSAVLAERCRRYVADEHAEPAVALGWLEALRLPMRERALPPQLAGAA
jgi:glycosyltransferase involved in cell wall biosynthesis